MAEYDKSPRGAAKKRAAGRQKKYKAKKKLTTQMRQAVSGSSYGHASRAAYRAYMKIRKDLLKESGLKPPRR